MEKSTNSEEKMAASKTFDLILQQIQHSCLNFQLSPFSAVISLKKSFAKNKSSKPHPPGPLFLPESTVVESKDETLFKIKSLEDELVHMQDKYNKLFSKCEAAYESIALLEIFLSNREETIKSLESAGTSARAAVTALNTKLVEKVNEFKVEKNEVIKEHEREVKEWKRDLGKARKVQKKLQKKLDALEAKEATDEESLQAADQTIDLDWYECYSICASSIVDYVPQYFCGQLVNPVCEQCCRDANVFIDDQLSDPFSSFSNSHMPSSMVSHWTPPCNNKRQSLLNTPSMNAHYVRIPDPGDRFISMEEFISD